MILDTSKFLEVLSRIGRDKENWSACVESKGPLGGCIHLRRKGSEVVFSPLTAVYCKIADQEIHKGSFWCEELQQQDLPWWDVLEIAHATIKCGNYNRVLRGKILKALKLPKEKNSKLCCERIR